MEIEAGDPDILAERQAAIAKQMENERALYLEDAQRLYDDSAKGGGSVAKVARRPTTVDEAQNVYDLQEKIERRLIDANPNLIRAAGILSSTVAGATANLYDPATAHADFDTARAVQRARSEASTPGKVLEGMSAGAGAAMTLSRFPGRAQIPASIAYGAVSDRESPVRGAVTMAGMTGASMVARRVLGPAAAPAVDAPLAQRAKYALHGGASEAVGGVAFDVARGAPVEEVASGAGLNLGLGMTGVRAPRRPWADPTPPEPARTAVEAAPAPDTPPSVPEPAPRPVEPPADTPVRPVEVDVQRRNVVPDEAPAPSPADLDVPEGVHLVREGDAVKVMFPDGRRVMVDGATPAEAYAKAREVAHGRPALPPSTPPRPAPAPETPRAEPRSEKPVPTTFKSDKPPETLRQHVRRMGGLAYGETMRGELDRLSNKESGSTGLVNKRGGGLSVEDMIVSAREEGLIHEGMEPRDFLEALEQEGVRGRTPQTEAQYQREQEQRLAERPEPTGDPTSIKNAVVNREREARGVGPMEGTPRQSRGEWLARGEALLRESPRRGDELVAELSERARPATTEESAALLIHRRRLRNAEDAANAAGVEAARRGDVDAAEEAAIRADAAEADLLRSEVATLKAGEEWGRTGVARQMEMEQDYSLARMQARRMKAQGYKPLTPEQAAETKALHEKIKNAQTAIAERDARIAQMEAERAANAFVLENQPSGPGPKSPDYGSKNRVVTREARDQAVARIRAALGGATLRSGIDPTVLVDMARVGAFHVEAGLRTFGHWSRAMIADLGESVRPHLRAVFDEARKQMVGDVREKVVAGMKDRVAKGEGLDAMRGSVHKIAEGLVRSGVSDRDGLIDAVHDVLKDVDPQITRREAMDLISGYGNVRHLDPDAAKAELRELKGQMQQLAKLEDMAAGRAPLKSGPERQAPGDEQRRLIKEVNEAKRQGGYAVRDPASQLRSALDATKTRLKHEIADLQRQIDARQKDVPNRTSLKLDPEAQALKARRDALRKDFDAVFGKPGMTDAARLQALKKRTQKRIEDLEKRTAAGDFAPKPKRGPVARDAEAIRLEANLETAKRAYQEALFRDKIKNENVRQRMWRRVLEVSLLPRAIKSAFDFSAPLRQGFVAAVSHPITAARALPGMFRAFVSKGAFERSEAEIRQRDNYRLYKRDGVFLAEPSSADPSRVEEAFMSRIGERIPGVAGSNRAYTAFLNRVRADLYDLLAGSLSRTGTPTPSEGRDIANQVNIATGRGVTRGNKAPIGANIGLWSPRLLLSRFQFLSGHGLRRASTPRVRKMMAAEYARFLIGAAVLYGVARMFGTETDPRSSDFLKIRAGKTRIDPWGGLQQPVVLEERVRQGQTKALSTGHVREANPWDTATRFVRTKMAPLPAAAIDAVTREDVAGRKTSPLRAALGLVTPMNAETIVEAIQEHGLPKGFALGVLSTFGVGVDTHSK